MSYFYKYNFVSPEPIYALVKEELKSYFDTGAVDDLLFPVYLNKCLEKLGRSSHAIVPVMLFVEDFQARLPENFYAIREAWFCSFLSYPSYQSGVAFYSQTADLNTVQIAPLVTDQDYTCSNPVCVSNDCGGECYSSIVQAVHKTILTIPGNSYKRKFLLKPGNISFEENCSYNYNETSSLYSSTTNTDTSTPMSGDFDSFDLHDNKFVTTFREGMVEVLMYTSNYDDLDNQLIPDNYRIKEFIEAFLKFKVFETLTNQINDETFNQLQQKMINYKIFADEAYIMAESEIRKQTATAKQRRIRKNLNRFNKYELPLGTSRYKGRR